MKLAAVLLVSVLCASSFVECLLELEAEVAAKALATLQTAYYAKGTEGEDVKVQVLKESNRALLTEFTTKTNTLTYFSVPKKHHKTLIRSEYVAGPDPALDDERKLLVYKSEEATVEGGDLKPNLPSTETADLLAAAVRPSVATNVNIQNIPAMEMKSLNPKRFK